jgi:NADH-quinone oxidoreductase subunit H
MGSLAVYGVALAGWTGNNKFSLMGGLRAAAQMISYELAMGITIVTMVLIYGTLDLYKIVDAQAGVWGIFKQPLAFIILFIVGMAETKRGPFDLPEAESELVAGYFTEYSGMKFLLFWMGEFAEIALFSILLTLLFLGGWHLPFLELPENSFIGFLIGHAIFMAKVMFLSVLQIVIRWTLPRFRYDKLMNLGWKRLLPISMLNLLVTAGILLG